MAESRRYALVNQLDIEQILLEAQTRWLRPAEICEILRNHRKFRIAPEPPNKPPSGSLFLFDRKVLRYFRKDGHNWRKKKDGKTVKEAHERLKAGSVDVLHCYYAHGEENENFQRRSYWMLEEDYMHIVLVHYREVKGNKTNFSRNRGAEEVIVNSQTSSPISSTHIANHNQVTSLTTDSTSLNSGPTSEYEEAESDNYQASSRYHSFPDLQSYEDRPIMTSDIDSSLLNSYLMSFPNNQYNYQGKQQLNFISLSGETEGIESNDDKLALNFEPQKQLELTSWEEVYEHSTPSLQGAPVRPVSSVQSATVGYVSKQENVLHGQHFIDDFNVKKEITDTQIHKKWQINSDNDSSPGSKWQTDQKLQTDLLYDLNPRFRVQKTHYMDLHDVPESFSSDNPQQRATPLQNDLQIEYSDTYIGTVLDSGGQDNLTIGGTVTSTSKQPLLDDSKTDGLKKLDSFTRWMSKELGEVDEPHLQSNSMIYWDTVNAVDNSSLSPQVHLDAYLLSPSLSQEQLFSIIDFSPNWAYSDSETKVLISGKFLKNQDATECNWSCMFGEVEVPVEVLADGVLRCLAPPHSAGRVPFYVSFSNRLACSEVREFEFRVNYAQDSDMADLSSGGTNDMLLHVRLGKLLSLGPVGERRSSSVCEKPYMSSKISLLMNEDHDEWFEMINLTSEKDFSPGKVKDQLLQKILKEKLHAWLLQKVTEDGKGPSILDKEGQGVLHLAASLGYGWAIAPTIAAGVNINFRDVNGWTALHWAAFCGRERTVVALIQMGAAPGALTDPSPKFPSGRTPADLASSNGHKGIAGFLAESSLTTHLSSLTLKDTKDGEVSETSKAIQTVSERIAAPVCEGDAPDVSLKDSLAAICNATQAAARIHQVFRVQSFQKKQFVECGDDKCGMSDERALSMISVKTQRPGQHDEPVHTAAIRIQNKFRGWKGRKEFLIIRQRIVKIQAHVRGHQVRKHYRKITWSVGIVEKAILRWRRKGSGLRGFRPEAQIEDSAMQSGTSKEDDYDFLKEGRKQTEERLQKALARVKSMAQYPEARDQYRRLLNVVSEFKDTKVVYPAVTNTSEEAADGYDDMIDLEALLDDDMFMAATS